MVLKIYQTTTTQIQIEKYEENTPWIVNHLKFLLIIKFSILEFQSWYFHCLVQLARKWTFVGLGLQKAGHVLWLESRIRIWRIAVSVERIFYIKNDFYYFLGIESIPDVSLFLCLFFLPGDEPQFNSDRSDISCIFLVICTCHTTCGMDRR